MVLDGLEDPVRFLAGTASALAQSLTDTDPTFGEFLRLCDAAGPDRCALAGHGTSAAERAKELLARLRQHPIPAPSAEPPGELTYGEALTLLKLAALPTPAIWPQAAALLEAAVRGDASALETIARGYASEEFHRGLEPGIAILCADSPARQDAHTWPGSCTAWRPSAASARRPRLGGRCPVRVLADPRRPPLHRPMDRHHPQPDPAGQHPIRPQHAAGQRPARRRRLGNAVLLTHDGYGHLSSADPSSCVLQATGRYLVDLGAHHPGPSAPPTASHSTPPLASRPPSRSPLPAPEPAPALPMRDSPRRQPRWCSASILNAAFGSQPCRGMPRRGRLRGP